MNENRAEVLERLKTELAFLENGGYRRLAHSPWDAGYIFEQSPSCPNLNDKTRSHRCIDCWLMEFVEPERRTDQSPCRFVQLTRNGITVDSLYCCSTESESEEVLRRWLRARIQEIENQLREVASRVNQNGFTECWVGLVSFYGVMESSIASPPPKT
jgi:hypothetical protein